MHLSRAGRRPVRPHGLLRAVAVAIGTAAAGLALAGAAMGFDVDRAFALALGLSWLCILALAVLPHRDAATRPAPAGWTIRTALPALPALSALSMLPGSAPGREVDPHSGLLRYDPELDDQHVNRACGEPWAVLVVEVGAQVAASVFDPAADAVMADAAERINAVASSYGGIVRRLNGPQFLVLVAGLGESDLAALAGTLHDGLLHDGLLRGVHGRDRGGDRGDGARGGARDDEAPYGRLVVGVAVATHAWDEVQGLIRSAAVAVTQGKRVGGDAPVFFHSRLAEEARERIAVGRALRTAIDQRRIDLVYQPLVDLTDGGLLGVEVLARWHDPVLGPIAADRFVRVAGEVGLSRQLDRLVVELALAQLGAWDRAGVRVPRIHLNVTPHTVAQGRAIGLADLLAAYEISPDRVTVEIQESPFLEGAAGSAAVQRLRDLGLRVALDDFGAGPSSFTQLATLPVTGVKIDRSLLGDHEADATVLGAIVGAGRALGLAVGAVGIETRQQRDLLRGLGCAVGQGHLFAPPLTPADLVDWLRTPMLVG
ncbi:EAL domain-containing protein [Nocardioides sp. BP30]|uniref:EAL domain-containing protein n=1 Tax=Nocardioides sp. BP30 TaxID=3036374 RepID=UPI0024693E9E|nr:EAL domain-containing protein [Nocardioides sp. BP30]WGL52346.1 EAL domain-containing protein [Nocardioides sp. BP30]